MCGSENACGFCGWQPRPHVVDYLTRIMAEHHRRIAQTETEEKKMKVSYTTIAGINEEKRYYEGELITLEKTADGYALTIRQNDGALVRFERIFRGELRFLGGCIGFGEA